MLNTCIHTYAGAFLPRWRLVPTSTRRDVNFTFSIYYLFSYLQVPDVVVVVVVVVVVP